MSAADPLRHSWGARAHLPALTALPEFEVVGVCTNHLDTARLTAGHFEIPMAFDDVVAMVEHPDVDVVDVWDEAAYAAAIDVAAEIDNPALLTWSLLNRATLLVETGRADGEPIEMIDRAVDVARQHELRTVLATALMRKVSAQQHGHQPTEVTTADTPYEQLLAEATMLANDSGDQWLWIELLLLRARTHLLARRDDAAVPLLVEALDLAVVARSGPLLAEVISLAASHARLAGDERAVARLLELAGGAIGTAYPGERARVTADWHTSWHPWHRNRIHQPAGEHTTPARHLAHLDHVRRAALEIIAAPAGSRRVLDELRSNGGVAGGPQTNIAGSALEAATRSIRMEQSVRVRDGRPLGVVDYGPAGGLPVMWCHGGPGSRHELQWLAGSAVDAGLRIICCDRPGYGLSAPRPGRTIGHVVDDLIEVADMLGIDQFITVGISTGGAYALATAANAPQRVLGSLVVGAVTDMSWAPCRATMDGPHVRAIWDAPDRDAAIAAAAAAYGHDFGRLLGGGMARVLAPSDEELFADPAWMVPAMAGFPAMSTHGVRGYVDDRLADGSGWSGFDINRITCPVSVLHGDLDQLVDVSQAEHTASILPTATLTRVPLAGHFSIEREIIAALIALIERIRSASHPNS